MTKPVIRNDEVVTVGKYEFGVSFVWDGDAGPPWVENDGHGVVSTSFVEGSKALGGGRWYDFNESLEIARKENWGSWDEFKAELRRSLGRDPTRDEITFAAVEKDYEYLLGWCNGDWGYIGVEVKLLNGKIDGDEWSDSVWGVGSSGDSKSELAWGFINEAMDSLNKQDKEKAELKTLAISTAAAIDPAHKELFMRICLAAGITLENDESEE